MAAILSVLVLVLLGTFGVIYLASYVEMTRENRQLLRQYVDGYVLGEGTENTLSNGGTFTAIDENQIDAVIFSKQDLTLNGAGSLTLTSPGGHGLVSKDDLVITGGTYTVSAASHGLEANDSIRLTGDTALTVEAEKDGLHAEHDEDTALGFVYLSGVDLHIEAEGDGISAGSTLQVQDGSYEILAGGGSQNGSQESSESWGFFPSDPGNRGAGEDPGERSLAADTREDSDSSASMKGLKAGDSLQIAGGSFSIDSADDGVHANGSLTIGGGNFTVASGDDAFHADEKLSVTGGSIQVTESYEGLEALHLSLEGGEISLTASDDGINAAGGTDSSGTEGGRDGQFGDGRGEFGGSGSSEGTISITGGTLYIHASGDGIDANGSLTISGGYTVVAGSNQGDTATLDYDTTAVITGGTFIGTGASGMAQTFSDSEQGVVAVSVGSQLAGTEILLSDASGNTLIQYTPDLDFSVVILSSPELVSGETYTLAVGSFSVSLEAG